MKRIFVFSLAAVCAVGTMVGCKKDTSASDVQDQQLVAGKAKQVENPGDCSGYSVALSTNKTAMPGYTIFTWTITNPAPGNGSNGTLQNLSHWDFVPSECLDANWQDVISASYRYGTSGDWTLITPTPDIQTDPSLMNGGYNCWNSDVFKFDYGTSGSTPTQYQMVLKGSWGTGDLNVYFKSGVNTGCCSKTFAGLGIGCPETEECSFSQGYWFANNAMHPDGVHPWTSTVTIGGYTYTNAEGIAIWNASNQGGIKDAKKAFTQLAAVRLSTGGVDPTELATQIATIENWLSTAGKLSPSNLPNESASAKTMYGDARAAANAISAWINNNHCQ